MTIQRFIEMADSNMRESDHGEWVRWEDYEKLQRAYETTVLALARYEKPGDVVRMGSRNDAPITYQSGVTYYVCPHYDYRAMRTSPCDKGCPP